jgi:L-asparaginase II
VVQPERARVWVEVRRGSLIESRHEVVVAVAGADGAALLEAGDTGAVVLARSAIKAMQALPLVEDGVAERFGLSDAELALACASHSGEARHVAAAVSMLSRIGADASLLACGAHVPLGRAARTALRERGEKPGRIHNNCSGKHAGMLALAAHHGWPLAGYHEAEHPVQRRMLREVARWTGVAEPEIATAVDGCGVVTFGVPLRALAAGCARFAAAAWRGEPGPARLVRAMASHPEHVAGEDRLCTRLMQVTEGRVLAKVGAEGVYCAFVPEASAGLALKVADGAKRAAEPALLAVLRGLELIAESEWQALSSYAEPEVENTRGEVVGAVVARVEPVDAAAAAARG